MSDARLTHDQEDESHSADSMFPLVYDELRAAAGRLMNAERANHTLQRTALVNEAYLKLAKGEARFVNKAHFFNAAAQAMRRILVDHALARDAQKRGGTHKKVELSDSQIPSINDSTVTMDWLALDEALTKLAAVAPRRAQIVSLKYFVGLSDAEIGDVLGIGEWPVRTGWAAARAWLYQQMRGDRTPQAT